MWPKLVLLDRDGVINVDSVDYILSPEQWQPIEGSLAAIARLTAAGIPVAVVTNQSAIGRGMLTRDTLAAIHARLNAALAAEGGRVDAIFFCPHVPSDQCDCRKPAAGLIEEALARFEVTPSDAVMIGDSARDLAAAAKAGVTAWLVRTGNGASALEKALPPGVAVFEDLAGAVDTLLQPRPETPEADA